MVRCMRTAALPLAGLLLAAAVASGAAQPAGGPADTPSLRLRMLAAEDARDASPRAIAPLLDGLKSPDAELRRVAVRALGRLERDVLRPPIAAALKDAEASVRAEAANALAQSVAVEGDDRAVGDVARALADALRAESHPLVRGALAAAIARLRHPDAAAGQAIGMLVLDVAFPQGDKGVRRPASAAVLLGALRGLNSVALAGVRAGPPRRDATGRPVTWLPDQALAPVASLLLDEAGRSPAPGSTATPPRTAADTTVRRLALQVLAGTRRAYPARGLALVDDPDEQVRGLAVRWAVDVLKDEAARATVAEAWRDLRGGTSQAARAWVDARVLVLEARLTGDPSAQVRYEAVRAVAQAALGARACRVLLAAIDDASVNVAKYALTNAGPACGGDAAVRARLDALSAAAVSPEPGTAVKAPTWHRPAYALVGFAQVDPAAARGRVLQAVTAREAWVRRYGAMAAGAVLADGAARQAQDDEVSAALASLVADDDVNVGAVALGALGRGWRADRRPQAMRALSRSGDELIIEAVAALRPAPPAEGGTPPPATADREVASACAAALARLTAAGRETSRDARLALIECVAWAGAAEDAAGLAPLLSDYDARVAEGAAAAMAKLLPSGSKAPAATPKPLPRLPLPTDADLARMSTARVVLTIRGRGDIVIRLRPDEAPLNAFRFLRLAESGYHTALTFHRVVPAFVAQGGSPLGNEFSGDGPFSRDEVGRLANLRGSIGLSTRGRDTGDAQFYVNLADNVRLDHTYTVFAQVEAGMDVVDALAEGDVIERVVVR